MQRRIGLAEVFAVMQRRIGLAEVLAETSHAEEDWFSGDACRNKSCRGGLV